MDIWSGTGKVIVELPDDLNARFDVETAYTGSFRRPTRITSDWPLERDAVTGWDDSEGTARRHVRARGVAGDGDGVIHIKTVNGDIELRRVAARGLEVGARAPTRRRGAPDVPPGTPRPIATWRR